MAERSGFFNSINGDRVYYAEDWAWYLAKFFSNGVFDNGLQVKSNNGMNIVVSLGDGFINGYRYNNDSNKIINIANADGVLDRVDNIVLRLNVLDNRKITAEVVQGTFSENAVAPILTRENDTYEIRIAKIKIPAGTTEITEDLIEDTRFDDNDCGNVICAVQNPNFTDILKQYEAIWSNLIKRKTDDFEEWYHLETNEFTEWFQNIKGQLSGDVAANLTNEVNKIKKELPSEEEKTKWNKATDNYQDLNNKPKINGHELKGNQTFENLGLELPRYKQITLQVDSWTKNEETQEFEYDIKDATITENHRVDLNLDNQNQAKFKGSAHIKSYNGGFKVITTEQPTEEVTGEISIIKYNSVGGDV